MFNHPDSALSLIPTQPIKSATKIVAFCPLFSGLFSLPPSLHGHRLCSDHISRGPDGWDYLLIWSFRLYHSTLLLPLYLLQIWSCHSLCKTVLLPSRQNPNALAWLGRCSATEQGLQTPPAPPPCTLTPEFQPPQSTGSNWGSFSYARHPSWLSLAFLLRHLPPLPHGFGLCLLLCLSPKRLSLYRSNSLMTVLESVMRKKVENLHTIINFLNSK